MTVNRAAVVIPYYLSLRYNIGGLANVLRRVVIPYYLSLRYNRSPALLPTAGVVIPYYLSLRYNILFLHIKTL